MIDKMETPRDRYDALVKALGEVFGRNRQDPNAVIPTLPTQFKITFVTVPGFPERQTTVDVSETVKQSLDANAAAAELYARYVAQRKADEDSTP